jgi:hypothetical protein
MLIPESLPAVQDGAPLISRPLSELDRLIDRAKAGALVRYPRDVLRTSFVRPPVRAKTRVDK